MVSKRDVALGAALIVGVLIPGLLVFVLARAGFDQLGVWVWVFGYGTVVIIAWAVYIRGIDFEPEGELRP